MNPLSLNLSVSRFETPENKRYIHIKAQHSEAGATITCNAVRADPAKVSHVGVTAASVHETIPTTRKEY